MRSTIFLLCALAFCACTAPGPDQSTPTMSAAYAAVLQGDGMRAAGILDAIDPAPLSTGARATRACMLSRLARAEPAKPGSDDAFLAAVLGVYQEYWLRALRAGQTQAEAEHWLLASLNALVAANGGQPAPGLDDLEASLSALIEARGAHSLHGVTLPFRELMLWTTETTQTYDVELPEGRQRVMVIFMDGFLSLGWAGFATCDVSFSGGWVTPDALRAVRSAYDLDSETFRVSYLAHEAQHFSDKKRFPDLEQPELEYRAKLAELALAKATAHELLESFAANTSADRGVPHSHANQRVVSELRDTLLRPGQGWREIEVARINAAARNLLEGDSGSR